MGTKFVKAAGHHKFRQHIAIAKLAYCTGILKRLKIKRFRKDFVWNFGERQSSNTTSIDVLNDSFSSFITFPPHMTHCTVPYAFWKVQLAHSRPLGVRLIDGSPNVRPHALQIFAPGSLIKVQNLQLFTRGFVHYFFVKYWFTSLQFHLHLHTWTHFRRFSFDPANNTTSVSEGRF